MAGMLVRVPETLWREVEPLLPAPERRFRYPGRKRYSERACLEGILTVLRWGIPWKELPQAAGRPSGKTCWRRFDEWQRAGVWPQLVGRLQHDSPRRASSTGSARSLDSTIVDAKKGRRDRQKPGKPGPPLDEASPRLRRPWRPLSAFGRARKPATTACTPSPPSTRYQGCVSAAADARTGQPASSPTAATTPTGSATPSTSAGSNR